MKKSKLFTSLQDEENWINMIQSQGYQLTKVNPLLATYHFEKCTAAPKPVRLDFREQILKEEYPNYLSLFSDYGWEPIQGSKRNGVHYFQKMNATSDTNIFSDKESKKAFYLRYQKFAYCYFFIFLSLYFTLSSAQSQYKYNLWQPKTWYLTPGLWEREGTAFWFGFLFETPFAIFRSGIIPLFLLAWSIYFLCIAEKVKREIKNLGE